MDYQPSSRHMTVDSAQINEHHGYLKLDICLNWRLWCGYRPYSHVDQAYARSPELHWSFLSREDPMDANDYDESTAFPLLKPACDVFGVPGRSRKQRGWYQKHTPSQPKGLSQYRFAHLRNTPRLPPELVRMVRDSLIDNGVVDRISLPPRDLASCTRVCREWADALRPRCFQQLTLHSQADVTDLLAFFRSPESKLAMYVKQLNLSQSLPSPPFFHLVRSPSSLIIARFPTSDNNAVPSIRSVLWQLPRRLPRAYMKNFTSLDLRDIHTRSFNDIIHLVWELSGLSQFYGTRLTWEETSLPPNQPMRWMKLRQFFGPSVYLRACVPTQYWYATWLTNSRTLFREECQRVIALVAVTDERLFDVKRVTFYDQSFSWFVDDDTTAFTIKLDIDLSRDRVHDRSLQPGINQSEHATSITLHLGGDSAPWIARIDWAAFAQTISSFPYLRQIYIRASSTAEQTAFTWHAYEHLKAACSESGCNLTLERLSD